MHISSSISEQKNILVVIPVACLAFLTLGSLSIYGAPDNYLVTLSTMTILITVVLILVLWRTVP